MNNSKIKTLVGIIIFLLITNVAMLIFFIVLSKPVKKQRNHEFSGMYYSLQKDVGFSKDQLAQYQTLRNEQMQKMKPLFNELRNAKKDFYGLIYSGNISDSLINADADSISQKQKRLDMNMFKYFQKVRSLCLPDQTQKFDSSLKKEVVRMVARPGKDSKRPPGNN